MQPDLARVSTFLGAVRRRLTLRAVAIGAAGGLALAAILGSMGWPNTAGERLAISPDHCAARRGDLGRERGNFRCRCR